MNLTNIYRIAERNVAVTSLHDEPAHHSADWAYMYVEMFETYDIGGMCKTFYMTDEFACAGLPKHVKFIRYGGKTHENSCFRRRGDRLESGC